MANKNNKQRKKLKRKFSGNQHTSRKIEFLDKTSLEDEKNNPSFSLYKKSTPDQLSKYNSKGFFLKFLKKKLKRFLLI